LNIYILFILIKNPPLKFTF